MTHVATVTIPVAGATLSDFPVLLTPDGANAQWDTFWATVLNGGGDVRIYLSDDTTQLPREVVSCDTSAQTGEIWTKVPTVSSSGTTDLHIYADGASSEPAADSTYGSEAVWADYAAVYHLEEDGSGGAGSIIDATGGGYDLTPQNTPTDAAGAFGTASGGMQFDGSTEYADKSSDPAPTSGVPHTISAWAKADNVTAQHCAVSLADIDKDPWKSSIQLRGDSIDQMQAAEHTGAFGFDAASTSNTFSASTWAYMVGVFATTTSRTAYLDADTANKGTNTSANNPHSLDTVTIAALQDGGGVSGYFDGVIDEVRLRAWAVSEDWITYEYDNQADPEGWYTVTEAGGGGGSILPQMMAHDHFSGGLAA